MEKRTQASFIFLLFGLFITLHVSAESKHEKEIQAHLQTREGSFRRILLSDAGAPILEELSRINPGCGEAVKKVYQDGHSLYSKVIDGAAVRLGDFPFASGAQDDTFYHYTTSKSFMESFDGTQAELLAKGAYEDIFVYIRSRVGQEEYKANWNRGFFVCESMAYSSWAPYGIEFHLNLKARLISLKPDLIVDALQEIALRFPEVGARCGTELNAYINDTFGAIHYHSLIFLIAEDSGVDVLDYFQKGSNFIVLTPDVFTGANPLGRVGGNERNGILVPEDQLIRKVQKQKKLPQISIVSAHYGDNIADLDPLVQDVTASVQRYANGKSWVRFKITAKNLDREPSTTSKDFKVTWNCLLKDVPQGEPKTVYVPAFQSKNYKFDISCE